MKQTPTKLPLLLLLLILSSSCFMCGTAHGEFAVQAIWENNEQVMSVDGYTKTHLNTRDNLLYVGTNLHVVALDGTTGAVKKEFKIPSKSPCYSQSMTFLPSHKSMWYSHTSGILPNFVLHHMDLETGSVYDYTIDQFASQGYIDSSLCGGSVLIAIVSTVDDPARYNTIAAFKTDGSQLESLMWSYSTGPKANLNAVVMMDEEGDATNASVWAFGSGKTSMINVKTGVTKFTNNEGLPQHFLIMRFKGFISPDKSLLYLAGMNQLRSENGVGLIAVNATNGKYVNWYPMPAAAQIQMIESIDRNHLYLSSEKGAAMFCMKEKKLVWYREYEKEKPYYIMSAIGSINTPIIAYTSSTKKETQFVRADQKGQLIGTIDEYFGGALIGNFAARENNEFYTCGRRGDTRSAFMKCSKRRIIS